MSTHIMPLDCDGFAAQLADYLEEDLSGTVRVRLDAHAALCPRCETLLADIALLRQDAASLPLLEPSRDLWAGIAERIDARVISLDAPRVARPMVHRTWFRPAVAAAALVTLTAGITHVATRSWFPPSTDASSAAQHVAIAAPRPDTQPVDAQPTSIATDPAPRPTAETGAAERPRSIGSLASSSLRDARTTTRTGTPARLVADDPMESVQPVYDREILKLRQIVKERRSQLDPSTIAVLEQSITVIDSAIAQSRAALAKDPASGFLATQLNHSLEKKVELLRTAALLPART